MPRKARVDVEANWYHVVSRGQRRQTLFYDEYDFEKYLTVLSVGLAKNNGRLGGYCLMPNHAHLLIYRNEVSLGEIMRLVNGIYGYYFNVRNGTSGHVFQSRFFSEMILKDRHLAAVVRYIHNNPVRAKIRDRAEQYRWSSDQAYRGKKLPSGIRVEIVPGFAGLAGRRQYRELIDTPVRLPRFPKFIGWTREARSREKRSRQGAWSKNEKRGRIPLAEKVRLLLPAGTITLGDVRGPSRQRQIAAIRGAIMVALYDLGYPPTKIATFFHRVPSAVNYVWAKRRAIT